jgi:hypothetical protein
VNAISLLFLMPLAAAGQPAERPVAEGGGYLDSPVYYERYDEPLLPNEENLELLHKGLLKLRHFPAVDVTDFNWTSGGVGDLSWWVQVEELRFLLPFIGSERREDQALARRWFESWYASQRGVPYINVVRWGDPMTAAYRGMVLVYYLKREVSRPDPDLRLVEELREAIREHQRFLADGRHFDTNSNHGLVEAMGLLEVTRVFPDPDLQRLGTKRMLTIVDISVSEKGTEMEHSPAYHFVFLDWLDRYAKYLKDLPFLDQDSVGRLFGYRRRMMDAAYYLQDHGGTVAQIGDSDSVRVADRYPRFQPTGGGAGPPVFSDLEAGFAVYKGERNRGDRRYVVFTVQSEPPEMPYHFHDDALSVYYGYDGETLLGDSGKYEYSPSRERGFFTSPAAHNTLFPVEYLRTRKSGQPLFVADSVAVSGGSGNVIFMGRISHTSADVVRRVVIPANGNWVKVEDAIRPPAEWSGRGASVLGEAPPYTVVVWNVGPGVVSVQDVVPAGENEYAWLLTTGSGRRYRLQIAVDSGGVGDAHRIEVHSGSRFPMLGWYSPAQFVKRPRTSVLLMVRPRVPIRVTTVVTPVADIPFGLHILMRGY